MARAYREAPATINVTNNIHGAGQDPETLAKIVQRRIGEQMNWRTHDVETELT